MGVLGWTYDQTLDTPMPAIKAALGARNRFVNSILKAVFGSADDAPTPPISKRKLTPRLFDAILGVA
jgi:hypothetical protein